MVSGSRKLSNSDNFKDIFISPDLTRKQAEEDKKLRLKLKEIRMKGEVLDGVKISKGRSNCKVENFQAVSEVSRKVFGNLESFHSKVSGKFPEKFGNSERKKLERNKEKYAHIY